MTITVLAFTQMEDNKCLKQNITFLLKTIQSGLNDIVSLHLNVLVKLKKIFKDS